MKLSSLALTSIFVNILIIDKVSASYFLVSSGTCNESGGSIIQTNTECQEASVKLGWAPVGRFDHCTDESCQKVKYSYNSFLYEYDTFAGATYRPSGCGHKLLGKTTLIRWSGIHANQQCGSSMFSCVCKNAIIASPSKTPTSVFAGQNYTVGKPQSRFSNNLGDFSVPLNYTDVGHSVDFLNITLREAGCDKPVTDPVIMMNENIFLKADFATPSVAIDTTKFSASKLIMDKSQGESIGVLKFCVRAEGYDGDFEGDNVSVSFRQDNFNVGYDLTKNTFNLEENKIIANDILVSENNVTASYSVDAFRCSTNYEADSTSEVLKQNDIIYVCIQPANASVYISDFNMAFWQDGAKMYTAVSVGVMVNPLSQLSTGGNDDKTKRVASRVISKFFEGEATPFVVKGNAFLSFSSADSRRLRSVQDSSQVGEGDFEMEVGLEKGISSTTMTRSSITKEGVVLCTTGGILVLSICMVIFKKMRV